MLLSSQGAGQSRQDWVTDISPYLLDQLRGNVRETIYTVIMVVSPDNHNTARTKVCAVSSWTNSAPPRQPYSPGTLGSI